MQELFYGAAVTVETLGFTSSAFPAGAMETINRDLTGAKLLDYLLLFIFQQKLSSLSLQPLGDAVALVGRKGGASREIGQLAPGRYPELVQRVRKLAKIAGAGEFSARGILGFAWKGSLVPFQVALLRGEGGDHLTLRLHVASPFPTSVADLGLDEEKLRRFAELAAAGRGLVLACSREQELRGRLIDLYLQERDTAGKTVLILGSGPGQGEKRFPRIPLPPETDLNALVMAALEHDPDLLVLEDATDGAAFSAACKAAIRGKLVVAGFACGDVPGALKQLLAFRDMHLLIPGHLRGMLVCKGVRTLCPECRRVETLTVEERALLHIGDTAATCARGAGCPSCDQTGYDGKRYLLEVVTVDQELRASLETAREAGELVELLSARGWRGLTTEGLDLVASGVISPEEFATTILT